MVEFKLPDVGEGMHEAEVVRWLVKPGETVKVDQVMLEIQTDKALVEIPAPVAGTVTDIKVKEGEIAHVGDVLIAFETAKELTTPIAEAPAAQITAQEVAEVAANNRAFAEANGANLRAELAPTVAVSKVRAAPAVRKRALELDVDLSQVQPSTPDGRVLLQDVLNYVEQRQQNLQNKPATSPLVESAPALNGNGHSKGDLTSQTMTTTSPIAAPSTPAFVPTFGNGTANEERKALVGLRRRIAERMEQSWRTIPHVATFQDADGEQLVALRQSLLPAVEKRGVKLTYLPIIVKALVQTLKQHPVFNSSLDEQTREIIYKRDYHIGLATATPDGLLVPVVHHADRLNLLQLAAEISRLTEGARNRSLKSQELSGSTITITNFGSYGGQRGTPIINPPEAAILGIGQLAEQAVVRNGQVVARHILPLTLSFDHRLIDGADAGLFINSLIELLENPSLLMLDMV